MPVRKVSGAADLQAENDRLRQQLDGAKTAREDLGAAIKERDGRIHDLRSQLTLHQEKIARLEAEAAGHDARVRELDAHKGPAPDEPRTLYPAEKPGTADAEGRTVANQAEEDALVASQPDYWYSWPPDAETRYYALRNFKPTAEATE